MRYAPVDDVAESVAHPVLLLVSVIERVALDAISLVVRCKHSKKLVTMGTSYEVLYRTISLQSEAGEFGADDGKLVLPPQLTVVVVVILVHHPDLNKNISIKIKYNNP